MTRNFRIIPHEKRENLHLQLQGVFDGFAARDLLYALQKHADEYERIFVHTGGLARLEPSGEAVFLGHCPPPEAFPAKVVFLGGHGESLAPHLAMPSSPFFVHTRAMQGWF